MRASEIRDEYVKYFRKYPQGVMSKKSTKYKIADALLRPIRGFNGVRNLASPLGMTVDDSVI